MDDGLHDPADATVHPHAFGLALRAIARTVPVTVRGASMAPVLRHGNQVVLDSRSFLTFTGGETLWVRSS